MTPLGSLHSLSTGLCPNDKPRRKAGLCDTVLDRAGKRVRRFERPTILNHERYRRTYLQLRQTDAPVVLVQMSAVECRGSHASRNRNGTAIGLAIEYAVKFPSTIESNASSEGTS